MDLNEYYQKILIDCYNENKQYNQAIKVSENLVKNFPDVIEFKEDLETLGNLFLSYEHLMKHAIYNGLDVNWLLEAEIPQNIVAIHKEIRANGFLK